MSAKKNSEETHDEEDQLISKKTEAVAKKRIIYAEIDDEVTALYDKIKPIKSDHIYIVVPKRAIIFQSVVNLKILKRKAQDDGKKLSLITDDKNGVYLAQQIGIPVYNKADDKGKPALFSIETVDEKLRITPLKASVNAIDDDAPTRMTERKISISEILRRKRNSKKVVNTSHLKTGSSVQAEQKRERSKLTIIAPNRHALIGLIAVSLTILLVVIYIALPGVTIYLTPSANVIEKSVNIILADAVKNKAELETHPTHEIASYNIETNVSKTIKFTATGKKFSERGANATGFLTVINNSSSDQELVAKTRFQTDAGLVFRLAENIVVPAAAAAGPGKVKAYVVADPVDAYGSMVGDRGNIPPGKFFIPGLKKETQAKIYAESSEPMNGGITDYVAFISKDDLKAAEDQLRKELVNNAVKDLRQAVKDKSTNGDNSAEYILLEGDGAVKSGDAIINIPEDLEGKELVEFNVSGQMHVSGVYYDKNQMLQILEDELLLKKSPQKQLIKVNDTSTNYRIFEWDEATGKIKLTANIKGIEEYEIDSNKENGLRLLEKIKDHIAGKEIEAAKIYIQNLPEVNKVEIDSWPAWSPTIPNLPENIEFEIREAKMIESGQ